MRFPGEVEALERAAAVADAWGHGNVIEFLLERWQQKDEAYRREKGLPAYPDFALKRKSAMGFVADLELKGARHMTLEQLRARRAHLLPIYANPDPAHELQHVEVTAELDWIAQQLRDAPRSTTHAPAKGAAS